MVTAFLVNAADSVAIVNREIKAGETVTYRQGEDEVNIVALNDIPIYHKIAIKDIAQSEKVIKYGESIGIAKKQIVIGEHVHTQNLTDIF